MANLLFITKLLKQEDVNTTIRNVDNIRDITRCYQIDIFDGFICNIIQNSI